MHWAALRSSSVESRFEALHTTGLTALVGREEESELLWRRWAEAQMGEGQVVLLSGESYRNSLIGSSMHRAKHRLRLSDGNRLKCCFAPGNFDRQP